MAKLLKDTIVYRVESEVEVKQFIEDIKKEYDVTGYTVTRKVTKDEEYYVVKINRFFANEKE